MIEGLPLGGLKDEKFNLEKHKFESGDILVMLSDGLPEAANYKNEMFDYERIKLLIEKNGNKYVIQYTSIGDIDSSFTYPITIYLDTKKETMYYTKYDSYMDRSFVTPCKSTITMKLNESQ